MKPEDRIKDLIHKSDINTDPRTDERILGDAREYLERRKVDAFSGMSPGIWETVKRSAKGRYAAAAVIVVATLLLVLLSDSGKSPAYALEQTIQANHTIETIHLRIITGEGSIENKESSDCWMRYNDAGLLMESRWNLIEADGVKFSVWNNGVSTTWMPVWPGTRPMKHPWMWTADRPWTTCRSNFSGKPPMRPSIPGWETALWMPWK